MANSPPDNCALCGESKPLRRSHILPQFFSEGAERRLPTGKSGQLQPFVDAVHTNPHVKLGRLQKGAWDSKLGVIQRLLCSDCEERFGKWENYVKRELYGRTSPIRLQLPRDPSPFFKIDYPQFKLFQLSILWRASVASGSFFEAVSLGEKHEAKIRAMLLSENPGRQDDYPCALMRLTPTQEIEVKLKISGAAIETISFAPIVKRIEGARLYTFLCGGLGWTFCVTSGEIPQFLRHSYVKETGVYFLSSYCIKNLFDEFVRKVVATGNYSDFPPENDNEPERQ